MKTRIILMVAATLLFSLAGTANATTWDMFTDFDTASNPSAAGVWEYGGTDAAGAFVLGTNGHWVGPTTETVWQWGQPGGADPAPLKNVTGSVIWLDGGGTEIPIDALGTHPGYSLLSMAVVRFAAPSAGTYHVATNMFGTYQWADGSVGTGILTTNLNLASPIASAYINGYRGLPRGMLPGANFTYEGDVVLAAGDRLDFISQAYILTSPPWTPGQAGQLASTPIGMQGTVTLIPEPSTLVLLTAGLAGLLAYAWRKRK